MKKAGLFLACCLLFACARRAPVSPAPDATAFGPVATAPDVRKWLSLPANTDAQVLSVEAGVAGDRVTSLLELPESDCAVIIARGSGTVDDVDLFAYGEDGTMLGSDEASDKAPALLVCPSHPRRIFIAARIAAGHGLVAIGAQRVAVKDAERLAALYDVESRPGEVARRLSVWPGLDEALERHRRSLGGTWVDLRRVAVPLDSRAATRVSVNVDANHCVDVFVLPSDDVASLDVSVLDEAGSIVGRAPGGQRNRTLVICSPVPGLITVEIRPRTGLGLAVVMLSRSGDNAERDIDPDAPRFDLFPFDSPARTEARVFTSKSQRKKVFSGQLSVGRRVSTSVDLPRGCTHVEIAGGAPLRGVLAWLWSPELELMASASGGGSALLVVCNPGQKARLDLEAVARGGSIDVNLVNESDAPPILFEEPLAASRLFARLAARQLVTRASELGGVKKLDLSPNKIASLDLKVPLGRCLEVSAAIGLGGSGVELRIVNRENNEQLELLRGSTSVSGRICAKRGNATLDASAELRVLAGHATGLVTTRLIDPRG